MEPLEIVFADLHNPLFFAGKNFGQKLEPIKLAGLKLQYYRDWEELHVFWQGRMAIVPKPAIASMEPGSLKDFPKPVQIVHPMVAGIASAQVETPFGHVHAGPGKGKSK